ncbi:homocitrate synthase [Astrocystis sublimbata]|nr:homocitrate synthase [Astrocystis sublimbata]
MAPSITHHTSHTMGNGASSSNSGDNSSGASSTTSLGHQSMGSGANDDASMVEASLTTIDNDNDNIMNDNNNAPSSPCSSAASVSQDDTEDFSDAGTYASGITSMSSSLNIEKFHIIDSTLREGEQFATAYFNTAQKLKIAQALDDFGVDYIEVTSPAASPQSRADLEAICKLGLKAKVLCHIRCNMDDARIAVQTGVDGINMCIGTSAQLMKHSHGKDWDYIARTAKEIIEYVRAEGIEIRFSGEDSFRSDFAEILKLYTLMDSLGANRVGVADTVGGALPMEVYNKVEALRRVISCDIETHFHNDTGCAIANAYTALEAGATHIDTTVLGIGERNGITPLGGLIGCLLPKYREHILGKYHLDKLGALEKLVAETVDVKIPWNVAKLPKIAEM